MLIVGIHEPARLTSSAAARSEAATEHGVHAEPSEYTDESYSASASEDEAQA